MTYNKTGHNRIMLCAASGIFKVFPVPYYEGAWPAESFESYKGAIDWVQANHAKLAPTAPVLPVLNSIPSAMPVSMAPPPPPAPIPIPAAPYPPRDAKPIPPVTTRQDDWQSDSPTLAPSSQAMSQAFGEEDVIEDLLRIIGENPEREGLLETPARVVKAWKHWTSGYRVDIEELLKVFEDGAENYDQMVIVKDIPIYSKCEHHLADIFGTVTIAYIPDGKIVGLSKLSRLADAFARRLQVQERLTAQIADALVEHLNPVGVGVIVKARHMCMESRGICQQGHHTITSALRGAIKDEPQTRAEFLAMAN